MINKVGCMLKSLHGRKRVIADLIAVIVFIYLFYSILQDAHVIR